MIELDDFTSAERIQNLAEICMLKYICKTQND